MRNAGTRTSESKGKRIRSLRIAAIPIAVATLIVASALVGSASGGKAKAAVAPTNTAVPTISGTATEGSVLTATNGTWTGTAPITYARAWQRCDSTGGSCAAISGATATTYTLKSPDVGNTLRVMVTATNADGSKTATSVPTAAVKAAAPPPAPTGCSKMGGRIAIADIKPPAHLIIDRFTISPSVITHGTQSLTARFHVSGCGGPVQGALVYASAVPFNQFTVPSEQSTDADGWATLNFTALAGYPATPKQQLLVMFVRARKSGEDILGGISARRLVSFRVSQG
jgi:hypothetical protein